MKRKLNEADIPEVVEPTTSSVNDSKALQPTASFDSLGLDARLLRAIASQKYSTPTLIQSRTIPLALQGKDVLARSKTGSGKTAAYALPVLQSILARKAVGATSGSEKQIVALLLVPTRELAGQVTKAVEALASFAAQDVRVENLTRKEDDKVQRARIAGIPDILIATPGRIATHINSSALSLEHVRHVVIDEADLVLSYGYDDDLRTIAGALPSGVQSILMSATLKEDVDTLKALFSKNPVVVSLDEEEKEDAKVSQYIVKCAEDEKFLLAYAMFVLRLIKGKIIIFVGDIDRCYKLKLFLEQFGIKSCVLNSELPVNSRIHVVEEFNRNVYDIIIATDENEVIGDEHATQKKKRSKKGKDDAEEDAEGIDETEELKDVSQPAKKKRKGAKTDKDYGVARGIDFQNVACVLNFDLPTSSRSYTHRIGRTARAGKTGMALSFVIPKNQYRKHKWTSIPSTEHDEEVLAKITKQQQKNGGSIEPYDFDMTKLDGFRYRLTDALKAVTSGAVREARVRELRLELIKSEKLKRHFEENPEDLKHLRHDGELRAAKIQPHMKHVPEYLLPGGAKKTMEQDIGFVSPYKPKEEQRRRRKFKAKSKKPGSTRTNPLQSFKGKG